MKKNESGFSLFELMVVIAIIGIMSTIAIPNYISWRNNAALRGTAFELKSEMESLKMRAIKTGGNIGIVFTSSGYETFEDTNRNGNKDGGEKTLVNKDLPNISFTAIFSGTQSTSFNNRGQALRIGTVNLSLGSKSIVLSVNRLGLITM